MGIQTQKTPGVTVASPAARRLQRSIALAVVIIPFLAFMAAIALVWHRGISIVEVGSLLGMYAVCTIGTTVGLHRHFAHGAFETSKSVRVILAILGSMAAQGPLLTWVASHRRHHVYSDQPGDPHSPNLHGAGVLGRLRGLWHAHIGWMFSHELTDWVHFARDLVQDRVLFRVHLLYPIWVFMGLAIPAVLGGILTWTWIGAFHGFLWGGLVRMFLVNQAHWCVGSVCHVFGSQPFDTKDHSANNYWVALLTFGEGLQNNHHAFPSSARHGLKWWQPDLSGWIIGALEKASLVWNVNVPTRAMIEAKWGYQRL